MRGAGRLRGRGSHSLGLFVNTFGTGTVPDQQIQDAITEVFDLRPAAIVAELDLLPPIYARTAAYGHLGRELPDFTWTYPRADALANASEGDAPDQAPFHQASWRAAQQLTIQLTAAVLSGRATVLAVALVTSDQRGHRLDHKRIARAPTFLARLRAQVAHQIAGHNVSSKLTALGCQGELRDR